MEKLEWRGYPMVKKFEDIFIHFGATHERDRQTDRRTDTACRHIPRVCIASRGKKYKKNKTKSNLKLAIKRNAQLYKCLQLSFESSCGGNSSL